LIAVFQESEQHPGDNGATAKPMLIKTDANNKKRGCHWEGRSYCVWLQNELPNSHGHLTTLPWLFQWQWMAFYVLICH